MDVANGRWWMVDGGQCRSSNLFSMNNVSKSNSLNFITSSAQSLEKREGKAFKTINTKKNVWVYRKVR